MRVANLQEGELYSVWGKRARLDRVGVDPSGRAFAEVSMGRGFTEKETLWAPTSRGMHDNITSIGDTWEDFKIDRDRRRAEGRRSNHINKLYRETLKPMGLDVNVYPDEIRIYGDYELFEKLLAHIGSGDASALADLLS